MNNNETTVNTLKHFIEISELTEVNITVSDTNIYLCTQRKLKEPFPLGCTSVINTEINFFTQLKPLKAALRRKGCRMSVESIKAILKEKAEEVMFLIFNEDHKALCEVIFNHRGLGVGTTVGIL